MVEHPDSGRLARAIEKGLAHCSRWSGDVYRSSSPAYASKNDLLSGVGSKRSGARWNPPNSFCAVYTSLDVHTAIDEALSHFRHYGLPITKAMPRVIVFVNARLLRTMDLNDRDIRKLLRVSRRQLVNSPWREEQKHGREALTQAIGRLVFAAGCDGLLVPSAVRTGGLNLIVFPDHLKPPASRLKIINERDLPRH
jgi:RES domain-containing protein